MNREKINRSIELLHRAAVAYTDANSRAGAMSTDAPGYPAAYYELVRASSALQTAAQLAAPAIKARAEIAEELQTVAREEAERRRRDTIAEDHADDNADLNRGQE